MWFLSLNVFEQASLRRDIMSDIYLDEGDYWLVCRCGDASMGILQLASACCEAGLVSSLVYYLL